MTRIFIFLLIAFFSWERPANAACTSPSGVPGQLQWNSPNMQFCNGSAWVTLNGTNTGGTCSTAGAVSYVSSKLVYCDGTNWRQTSAGASVWTCSGTTAGYFYYSSADTFYWYCDASHWFKMGP